MESRQVSIDPMEPVAICYIDRWIYERGVTTYECKPGVYRVNKITDINVIDKRMFGTSITFRSKVLCRGYLKTRGFKDGKLCSLKSRFGFIFKNYEDDWIFIPEAILAEGDRNAYESLHYFLMDKGSYISDGVKICKHSTLSRDITLNLIDYESLTPIELWS